MIHPSLVLVQSRKTRLHIIERLLMGRKESNQNLQMFAWKYVIKIMIITFKHKIILILVENSHARIQKVLSEGVHYDNVFCVLIFLFMRRESIQYHYKWVIIGPPAKRHLNGVSSSSARQRNAI